MGIDFFFAIKALPLFYKGLLVTLELTLYASLIGLVCGLVVALATMSKWRAISMPAIGFVELFRCTPALVQVVWIFFVVPLLTGLSMGPILSCTIALGANITAFNAEGYRAAIQSIDSSQLDAATALGLPWHTKVLRIIAPQALAIAVPVLITNVVSIFQQSSLVALVAVPELFFVAKKLASSTYQPVAAFTVVGLFYLAVALPLGQLVNYLERRRLVKLGI